MLDRNNHSLYWFGSPKKMKIPFLVSTTGAWLSLRNDAIAGPYSSREDMVSGEYTSHGFALEPLALRVRLRQEVDEGSKSDFEAWGMTLFVPLVV